MKKPITIVLSFSLIIFQRPSFSQSIMKAPSSYEEEVLINYNIDLHQFMRQAKSMLSIEKKYTVPSAITAQYNESINSKLKYFGQTLNNFANSYEYLNYKLNEFNKTYNELNTNTINSINTYKNILTHRNKLSHISSDIKNAIYTYRNAEIEIKKLKQDLNNYCEKTSFSVMPEGLVLEPFPYAKQKIEAKVKGLNELLGKDKDVTNTFLGTLAAGAITAITISVVVNGVGPTLAAIKMFITTGSISLGATGWGALVVVAIVAIATLAAWLSSEDQARRERERVEKLKQEVQKRYDAALDWYKQNSILNKPDEIRKIAFEICSTDKYKLLKKNGKEEEISIYNRLKYLNDSIDQNLNISLASRSSYSITDLEKLKNILKFEDRSVLDPEILKYKDEITQAYIKSEEVLSNLNTILDIKRKELSAKFAQKDIEEITLKLASSEKLAKAADMIYQEIGTKQTKKLLHNYINSFNADQCNNFKEINEKIISTINIIKDEALREYKDEYNKNEELFTKKLPELINSINRITEARTNKVCGENI